MLTAFIAAIAFTIGASFFCSLLEAFILSTTVAEIEALKKSKPKKGLILEQLHTDLPNTIASILTLNTIANSAGATVVGGLASSIWFGKSIALWIVSTGLVVSILIFSEIIPKNLGVVYRVPLQPWVVGPLSLLKKILTPIVYLTNLSVKLVIKESKEDQDGSSNEDEIILLAEKGAKEGKITSSESDMVTNALKIDDLMVSEIMTPRVVVTALEKNLTVEEVFKDTPNIPFARIPVYEEDIDHVVGLIRRRDLLKQKAEDQDKLEISEFMDEVHFIPETVTVHSALQTILKTHQQLLVVVDEFGSMAGVVTMEDIMEYILGREIFEKDDVAIDMRELARHESRKAANALSKEESTH